MTHNGIGWTYSIILVLYVSKLLGAIIWVASIVLVNPNVAAGCADHEIDNFSYGASFVLVESGNPLCGHVLESGTAREYLSCRVVSALRVALSIAM